MIMIISPLETPTRMATQTLNFEVRHTGNGSVASVVCTVDGAAVDCSGGQLVLQNTVSGNRSIVISATDSWGRKADDLVLLVRVDLDNPVINFSKTPADPSSMTSFQFEYSATDGTTSITSITCKLNAEAEKNCDSPTQHSITGLTSGTHSFVVSAVDSVGNKGSQTVSWKVDTSAPEISLTQSVPTYTKQLALNINFAATGDVGEVITTRCQLDGGAWSACQSPYQLVGLTESTTGNPHVVKIEAKDPSGNTSVKTVNFFVDLTPPTGSITFGATSPTRETTVAASFFATDNLSSVTSLCSKNGAAAEPCSFLQNFDLTIEGTNELALTIRDLAGNESVVKNTIVRDTIAPAVEIVPSTSYLDVADPRFSIFSHDGSGSGVVKVECHFNSNLPVDCTNAYQASVEVGAPNILEVWAFDKAGNKGVAQLSWTYSEYSLAMGDGAACQIKSGEIVCWGVGFNYPSAVDPIRLTEPQASKVKAGGRSACAIVSGDLKCWGTDFTGSMGLGGSWWV